MSGEIKSQTISPETLAAEYVHPANCSFRILAASKVFLIGSLA